MVKRWIAVGVMLLACFLVVGCGVPQEEYDAVVADTEAVKTQAASLQSQLDEVKTDLAEAEDNLAAVQNELAAVQDDTGAAQDKVAAEESRASSAQSQVSSLESEIEAAEARIAELEAAIAAAEEAATAAAEAAAAREAAPKLRLLWSWSYEGEEENGVWGEVENISGKSLTDVEVVVYMRSDMPTYHEGTVFTRTVTALIDKNPLLPGESSKFRASTSRLFKTTEYTIYFRFLDGEEIPHVEE